MENDTLFMPYNVCEYGSYLDHVDPYGISKFNNAQQNESNGYYYAKCSCCDKFIDGTDQKQVSKCVSSSNILYCSESCKDEAE